MRYVFFLWLIGRCCLVNAQETPVEKLEEVVINATKLEKNSKAYKITSLTDSVIVNNLTSFTALLRFNTPIYFKEYGQGGTSSASFRGTSSANTAVMWNGININSINNGQTGFNSLTVGLYDAIDVRSGGGSIEYGSGAVGGTIHLRDVLRFSDTKQSKHQIVTSAGSFSTVNALYKLKYTDMKHAFNIGMAYNRSDNDYPLLDTPYRNSNGAYDNISINFANSYRLSPAHQVSFYSQTYFANRLLSGELPNPTTADSQYKDINHRNLLLFKYRKHQYDITTRLAYLYQEYQYFETKTVSDYNFGSSDRYFVDVDVAYNVFSNANITSNTRVESVFGRTDRIKERRRNEFSQSLILTHNVTPLFGYDLKIRSDFNSDYTVPTSYALGFRYQPYQALFLRANTSKNYRVPTYNDLYWPGQGNVNLVPETSVQYEVGAGLQTSNYFLDVAYFTINSKDNIVWTPNGNPKKPGIWTPINIENTQSKGIEASLKTQHHFNKDLSISSTWHYAYTLAKNKKNNRFLILVPRHLANANTTINFKKCAISFQQLYTGSVFTTEDNENSSTIEGYYVLNTGIRYYLIKNSNQTLQIGFKANNILNKNYVVLARRPMPGFNYQFSIHFKI